MDDPIFANQIMALARSILSPREYDVVYATVWHSVSMSELSREYQVSPERVRQIQAKALRKLRESQPLRGV